ncbi:MAG: hypothetical protein JXA52_01000 [Planctomycetes bacterium]|nr:hypothetical protein [Planctomycetota bacterium]
MISSEIPTAQNSPPRACKRCNLWCSSFKSSFATPLAVSRQLKTLPVKRGVTAPAVVLPPMFSPFRTR